MTIALEEARRLSTERMDESVKRRWLEALRSGDYQQTDAYLSRDNRYCCLGVLCEIALEDGVVRKQQPCDSPGEEYFNPKAVEDYSGKVLPEVVSAWASLIDENPTLIVNLHDLPVDVVSRMLDLKGTPPINGNSGEAYYKLALAELNDIYGLSFSQIADLVEKYL